MDLCNWQLNFVEYYNLKCDWRFFFLLLDLWPLMYFCFFKLPLPETRMFRYQPNWIGGLRGNLLVLSLLSLLFSQFFSLPFLLYGCSTPVFVALSLVCHLFFLFPYLFFYRLLSILWTFARISISAVLDFLFVWELFAFVSLAYVIISLIFGVERRSFNALAILLLFATWFGTSFTRFLLLMISTLRYWSGLCSLCFLIVYSVGDPQILPAFSFC